VIVTFVVWTKGNENPVVMKKPPIQQTFLTIRRRNDKLNAFLLSGFLRPFLVIEKENIKVLISSRSFCNSFESKFVSSGNRNSLKSDCQI
jgi:hypothetical protein